MILFLLVYFKVFSIAPQVQLQKVEKSSISLPQIVINPLIQLLNQIGGSQQRSARQYERLNRVYATYRSQNLAQDEAVHLIKSILYIWGDEYINNQEDETNFYAQIETVLSPFLNIKEAIRQVQEEYKKKDSIDRMLEVPESILVYETQGMLKKEQIEKKGREVYEVFCSPFLMVEDLIKRENYKGKKVSLSEGLWLKACQNADKNPHQKIVILMRNFASLSSKERVVLQEAIRSHSLSCPLSKKVMHIPSNIQFILTDDFSVQIKDRSYYDRFIKKRYEKKVQFRVLDDEMEADQYTYKLECRDELYFLEISNQKETVSIKLNPIVYPHYLEKRHIILKIYREGQLFLEDKRVLKMLFWLHKVRESEKDIYLIIEGETGVGKTFTAKAYAQLIGEEYENYPISRSSDISDLIGFYEVHQEGIHFYDQTPFRQALEKGKVITLSEMNVICDEKMEASAFYFLIKWCHRQEREGVGLDEYIYVPQQKRWIKTAPQSLVVLDINPSQSYENRGKIPSIAKILPHIKIDSLRGVECKIEWIRKYLHYFLSCPFQLKGRWIEEIKSEKEKEIYIDILIKIMQKVLHDNIDINVRKLKNIIRDILIERSLKGQSNEEIIKKVIDVHFLYRYSEQKRKELYLRYLWKKPSEMIPGAIQEEDFIDEYGSDKGYFILMNLPLLYHSNELIKSLMEKYGFKVQRFVVTDETSKEMLQGGEGVSIKEGQIVVEVFQGVIAQWCQKAQRDTHNKHILVLDNVHNMKKDEWVAFNELLQTGIIKLKNSTVYRLPQNGTILFISKGKLDILEPERSRFLEYQCVNQENLEKKRKARVRSMCATIDAKKGTKISQICQLLELKEDFLKHQDWYELELQAQRVVSQLGVDRKKEDERKESIIEEKIVDQVKGSKKEDKKITIKRHHVYPETVKPHTFEASSLKREEQIETKEDVNEIEWSLCVPSRPSSKHQKMNVEFEKEFIQLGELMVDKLKLCFPSVQRGERGGFIIETPILTCALKESEKEEYRLSVELELIAGQEEEVYKGYNWKEKGRLGKTLFINESQDISVQLTSDYSISLSRFLSQKPLREIPFEKEQGKINRISILNTMIVVWQEKALSFINTEENLDIERREGRKYLESIGCISFEGAFQEIALLNNSIIIYDAQNKCNQIIYCDKEGIINLTLPYTIENGKRVRLSSLKEKAILIDDRKEGGFIYWSEEDIRLYLIEYPKKSELRKGISSQEQEKNKSKQEWLDVFFIEGSKVLCVSNDKETVYEVNLEKIQGKRVSYKGMLSLINLDTVISGEMTFKSFIALNVDGQEKRVTLTHGDNKVVQYKLEEGKIKESSIKSFEVNGGETDAVHWILWDRKEKFAVSIPGYGSFYRIEEQQLIEVFNYQGRWCESIRWNDFCIVFSSEDEKGITYIYIIDNQGKMIWARKVNEKYQKVFQFKETRKAFINQGGQNSQLIISFETFSIKVSYQKGTIKGEMSPCVYLDKEKKRFFKGNRYYQYYRYNGGNYSEDFYWAARLNPELLWIKVWPYHPYEAVAQPHLEKFFSFSTFSMLPRKPHIAKDMKHSSRLENDKNASHFPSREVVQQSPYLKGDEGYESDLYNIEVDQSQPTDAKDGVRPLILDKGLYGQDQSRGSMIKVEDTLNKEDKQRQEKVYVTGNECIVRKGGEQGQTMSIWIQEEGEAKEKESDIEKSIKESFLQGRHVVLEGPPGTGKTWQARQVVQSLKVDSLFYSMTKESSLFDWIGSVQKNKDGQWELTLIAKEGQEKEKFLELLQKGGVFIIDEASVGKRGKALISWLTPLFQGEKELSIQEHLGEKRRIRIHPQFHILMTKNDYVQGVGKIELPLEVKESVTVIKVGYEKESQWINKKVRESFLSLPEPEVKKIVENLTTIHHFMHHYTQKEGGIGVVSLREIKFFIELIKKIEQSEKSLKRSFMKTFIIVYLSRFSIPTRFEIYKQIKPHLTFEIQSEFVEQMLVNDTMDEGDQLKVVLKSKLPAMLFTENYFINHKMIQKVIQDLQLEAVYMDCYPQMTWGDIVGKNLPDVFKSTVLSRLLVEKIGENKEAIVLEKVLVISNIESLSEEVLLGLNDFIETREIRMNRGEGIKVYQLPQSIGLIVSSESDQLMKVSCAFMNRLIKIRINNFLRSSLFLNQDYERTQQFLKKYFDLDISTSFLIMKVFISLHNLFPQFYTPNRMIQVIERVKKRSLESKEQLEKEIFWEILLLVKSLNKGDVINELSILEVLSEGHLKNLLLKLRKEWKEMREFEHLPDGTILWMNRVLKQTRYLIQHFLKDESLVLVQGETGQGKTSLCQIIAQEQRQRYNKLEMTSSSHINEIWGTMLIQQSQLVIQPSFLFNEIEQGNVLVNFDEMNVYPELMYVFSPLLRGDKKIEIGTTLLEQSVIKEKGVDLIATGNPMRAYTGRKAIPSFLFEKVPVIQMSDYTEEEREQLAKSILMKSEEKQGETDTIKDIKFKDMSPFLVDYMDPYFIQWGWKRVKRGIHNGFWEDDCQKTIMHQLGQFLNKEKLQRSLLKIINQLAVKFDPYIKEKKDEGLKDDTVLVKRMMSQEDQENKEIIELLLLKENWKEGERAEVFKKGTSEKAIKLRKNVAEKITESWIQKAIKKEVLKVDLQLNIKEPSNVFETIIHSSSEFIHRVPCFFTPSVCFSYRVESIGMEELEKYDNNQKIEATRGEKKERVQVRWEEKSQGSIRFYAQVLSKMYEGERYLPSISSDMKIVDMKVKGEDNNDLKVSYIEVKKNSSGTFFVKVFDKNQLEITKPLRFKYIIDVPHFYFYGDLPEDAIEVLKEKGSVKRVFWNNWWRLTEQTEENLDQAITFKNVVTKIVRFFRSCRINTDGFSSNYEDILKNEEGNPTQITMACAYTLLKLGFQVRLCHSWEACFVELWVPSKGWLHISIESVGIEKNIDLKEGTEMDQSTLENENLPLEESLKHKNKKKVQDSCSEKKKRGEYQKVKKNQEGKSTTSNDKPNQKNDPHDTSKGSTDCHTDENLSTGKRSCPKDQIEGILESIEKENPQKAHHLAEQSQQLFEDIYEAVQSYNSEWEERKEVWSERGTKLDVLKFIKKETKVFIKKSQHYSQSLNILIQIDTSGSMKAFHDELIQTVTSLGVTLYQLRENLGKDLQYSFMYFNEKAHPPIICFEESKKDWKSQEEKFQELIQKVGGMTNIYEAFLKCKEEFDEFNKNQEKSGRKVLVFFTDGIHSPSGNEEEDLPDEFETLIKDLNDQGVFIIVIGLGAGVSLAQRFTEENQSYILVPLSEVSYLPVYFSRLFQLILKEKFNLQGNLSFHIKEDSLMRGEMNDNDEKEDVFYSLKPFISLTENQPPLIDYEVGFDEIRSDILRSA